MHIKIFLMAFLTISVLAACSNTQSMGDMDHSKMNMEQDEESKSEKQSAGLTATNNTEMLTGNVFNLVAKEARHQLNEEVSLDAWTFNGSVPGAQIRVKEGEKIKINLKNELPDPVSIHWHGIPLPNEMDGIPGVTQNAVKPGESFTYEFVATHPGTYMYHTHQDGVNQIDKGLYGSFIVEPDNKSYNKDFTIMLDEWMSNPIYSDSQMAGMDHGNMSDMHGNDEEASSEKHNEEASENHEGMGHDMSNYDVFTMNGKSGNSIEPLMVKENEKVRIRLINIGYQSHRIHLHGHKFKIAAIDGQEINSPAEIENQLVSIAPGERYDIEFTADNPGTWHLESHGKTNASEGMKTLIKYEGSDDKKDQSNQKEDLPLFDFNMYGSNTESKFTLNQKYDVEYTMDLNTAMNDRGMVYTINNEAFPNTANINVKKGDTVKVKLVNQSKMDDHPMHLHGHFFQVLSKNGKPLEGSPIIKDTINLKPGDEYVVAFEADNPGNWLFHCHDLHHATAGMVNLVKYEGYKPSFTPDGSVENKPE